MQIDWNEKLRPKGPLVQSSEGKNEKPTLPDPVGGKRKLWEILRGPDDRSE